MRALFGTVASGQIPPVTAFAFDVKGNAAPDAGGGRAPLTWTHTPVGIPKGVVVLLANENTALDLVDGITYGGVAMTEMAGSPFVATLGGELDCVLYGYFLGSSIPVGAQTVSVDNSDSATALNGVSFTMTGPNNTAVEDTSGADSNGADPTVALTVDEESFICGVLVSGHDASASVDVASGYTQALEVDVGASVQAFAYKTALASTNTSMSWTALTEDYAIFACAIKST